MHHIYSRRSNPLLQLQDLPGIGAYALYVAVLLELFHPLPCGAFVGAPDFTYHFDQNPTADLIYQSCFFESMNDLSADAVDHRSLRV